jgi:putative SOS response-associated peptidase YedK
MCGRYTQTVDLKKLVNRFGIEQSVSDLPPRYNVAPGQLAPIVLQKESRALKLLQWGLVPSWAKDREIGHKMINARSETLGEKPSFKRPLRQSRCLVLADGFYEWRQDNGTKSKTPMWIGLATGEPFAFAGLWDEWRSPEGQMLETFTIVTTAPNKLVKPIHQRMPVILEKNSEGEWLDPKVQNVAQLIQLLKPYPSRAMKAHEVSTLVNSPKNDVRDCIRPVRGNGTKQDEA